MEPPSVSADVQLKLPPAVIVAPAGAVTIDQPIVSAGSSGSVAEAVRLTIVYSLTVQSEIGSGMGARLTSPTVTVIVSESDQVGG